MKRYLAACAACAAVLLVAVPGEASPYTEIAPLPGFNSDLNFNYTNGTSYPFGGSLTVGGVPFTLTTDPCCGSDTLVIQDPGFMFGFPVGVTVFDIPVGVFGVKAAYTLADSAFGAFGANIASIEFIGTGGADAIGFFIEGINIRDHFTGGFNNVATDVQTIDFGDGVHLDMQT